MKLSPAEKLRAAFIRIVHWEYWPSWLVYLPVFPRLGWLMLRARSIAFFTAANPGIKNGGFIMESKWQMVVDAPEEYFLPTVLIQPNQPLEEQLPAWLSFPCVAKPEIGGKGRGVVMLKNKKHLTDYHATCPLSWLLQQKSNYPLEAGIFYARFPGEEAGMITAIVQKDFVCIVGDSKSTVRQLIAANPRYLLQLPQLASQHPAGFMQHIPVAGEQVCLLEVGNHARGSRFTDASKRINEQLTRGIDRLSRQFPGFYYGRLDIRFESWEKLEQGEAFHLIELNGSGSEPTHIFDPGHSLFFAWKEIVRHWNLLFAISRQQHMLGVAYVPFWQAINHVKQHRQTEKILHQFTPPLHEKETAEVG